MKAGQDQTFWEEKGWINPQDPRGWFQWYTRFFLGRRTEDDQRQISRWRGVTGAKGRWKRFLLNKIVGANAHLHDTSVSPVVRQTLLHWVRGRSLRRFLTVHSLTPPPCLTPTRAKRVTRSRRRIWSAMSREGEKAEAALLIH